MNDGKREWTAKNKKIVYARQKKWRKENVAKARETARISAAKRYAKNPEKFRANNRKYRLRNPEREKEKLRKYRKAHPEVIRAIETRKRVAGKVNAQDLKSLMTKQNGLCYYCFIDIFNKYHIDHYLPITLGGLSNVENIVLSCPKCNLTKNSKHPDVFMAELKNKLCLK